MERFARAGNICEQVGKQTSRAGLCRDEPDVFGACESNDTLGLLCEVRKSSPRSKYTISLTNPAELYWSTASNSAGAVAVGICSELLDAARADARNSEKRLKLVSRLRP